MWEHDAPDQRPSQAVGPRGQTGARPERDETREEIPVETEADVKLRFPSAAPLSDTNDGADMFLFDATSGRSRRD